MPSLKDLKNRIASVKATQKITKAMKMVAAAKLRRAQEAAEAARPYAERMTKVLAGLSAANAGNAEAPLLLSGTGKDQVHLLIVATGERGLAGGFNSSIIRLARDHALKLLAQGKTVKILTVGRKGNDILRRSFRENIVDYVTFREVKQLGFAQADEVAHKVLALYNAGEFDVATLFFARFQSVISQVATASQIIRPSSRPPSRRPPPRRSTNTSRAKRKSSRTCCRRTSPCRSSGLCSKTTLPSMARRCPQWTTRRAMPVT